MHNQARIYLHWARRGRRDRRCDHRRALARLVSGFQATGRSSPRFAPRFVLRGGCGRVHERMRQSEPHCFAPNHAGGWDLNQQGEWTWT